MFMKSENKQFIYFTLFIDHEHDKEQQYSFLEYKHTYLFDVRNIFAKNLQSKMYTKKSRKHILPQLLNYFGLYF